MKFAYSTFVHFRYPLIESIRRAAEMGYNGVEIWGGRCHAYYEDMDDARINLIKKTLTQYNMEVPNFIPAQFRYPSNIAAGDSQIRKNSISYLCHNVDVAEKLGASSVSICPGYSLYGQDTDNAWNCMMDSISRIVQYADDKKVMIMLEPAHNMETDLVLTVDHGLKAVAEIGGNKMGLVIDTGHMFVNRESFTDIPDKVKGIKVHYHFDDNHGINDDHLVPGEGKIDYSTFITALKKTGYANYLSVELGWGYTADPDIALQKSLAFFKKYAV